MSPLAFHPLAEIFPLIEGEEFDELVADIQAHGVREPIWLYQGHILDGRNRWLASQVAGADCPTRIYDGDDPASFIVSLNLKRRHLSESQRAMAAAKLATFGHGGDRSKSPIGDLTQAGAAALLKVGKRSVERAVEVRESGAPELHQAVERGEISISAAADVASMSLEAQRELLAQCDRREVINAAKKIRAERIAERHATWTARTLEIAKRDAPLPERLYPIILADPPWPFEACGLESGMERAAEVRYPTMSIEEICDLGVANICTPHAMLFLWTTSPHLATACGVVMPAWGFRYVVNIAWDKGLPPGLGYVVRNQHELLLIGKRGEMRNPPEHARPPSVIRAPRREHSRKPDEAYALIERMYPELPKIELFARSRRPGWDAWGNEVPPPDSDWPDTPDFLLRAAP